MTLRNKKKVQQNIERKKEQKINKRTMKKLSVSCVQRAGTPVVAAFFMFVTNYARKFMQTERFFVHRRRRCWYFLNWSSFFSLSVAHSMTWQKNFIHFSFFLLMLRSVSALKHRSTRKTVLDGNIIIVATKTLRLQPNYSKMNVILTSFQHNFVSWLHPTEIKTNSLIYYNQKKNSVQHLVCK